MNCRVCGKPVLLLPSAVERAKKHGQTPQYYTNLFPCHTECELAKRKQATSELMRKLREEAEASKVLLKGSRDYR